MAQSMTHRRVNYPSHHPVAPDRAQPVVIRLARRREAKLSPLALVMILGFGGIAALLFLVFTLAFGAYFYYQGSGRILPGVRVGDASVAGMSVDEAALYLDQTWNHRKTILASNGLQHIEVSPAELGLRLDGEQTARRAHNVGHGGTLIAEAAQMFASLKDGFEVEPVVYLDEEAARAGLSALTPQMSLPAKDANLRVENGALVAVSYELGYTINIEATLEALKAKPQDVLSGGVLQVIPQPVLPAVTDVTPAIEQAQRLIHTTIQLHIYDPISDEHNWLPVPSEAVASWIQVQNGENGPQAGLDPLAVQAYLNTVGGDLGNGRYFDGEKHAAGLAEAIRQGRDYTITVSHRPTRYTVQQGDTLLKIGWKVGMPYWKILQANPQINPDAIGAGEELIIPSKDELIPLPVVTNKRVIISISRQRMWVYQDGAQIKEFVISTGIDRSPTQPGVFQVQTHDPNAYASVWDLYMPHFLGIYEAWPGFMNGIHGLPMLSNGRRLWANILGRPASYGCIILDLKAGEWLYHWAEDGVIVEIKE